MADKDVILMNEPYLYGNEKVTKLKVGTWSDEQCKRFIQGIYDFEPQSPDCHFCTFNVEYGHIWMHGIGLFDYENDAVNDFPDALKHGSDRELVIIMSPYLLNKSCKCGVKSPDKCPMYVKDGKCTAPSIKKLVGEVLFSDKYNKKR